MRSQKCFPRGRLVLLMSMAFVSSCKTRMYSETKDFGECQLFDPAIDLDASGFATTPRELIALTFDDGPGQNTAKIGLYLREQGIRATFFVVGSAAKGKEGILQALSDQGHLIANHSLTHHEPFDELTARELVKEIELTDMIIRKYVDNKAFLFRAPQAKWKPEYAQILNEHDLSKYIGPIKWNRDGGDWKCNSRENVDPAKTFEWPRRPNWECTPELIAEADVAYNPAACYCKYLESTEKAAFGGPMLMHDHAIIPAMEDSEAMSDTLEMVKRLVPKLKQKGYKFVRLDELPPIAEALRKKRGCHH